MENINLLVTETLEQTPEKQKADDGYAVAMKALRVEVFARFGDPGPARWAGLAGEFNSRRTGQPCATDTAVTGWIAAVKKKFGEAYPRLRLTAVKNGRQIVGYIAEDASSDAARKLAGEIVALCERFPSILPSLNLETVLAAVENEEREQEIIKRRKAIAAKAAAKLSTALVDCEALFGDVQVVRRYGKIPADLARDLGYKQGHCLDLARVAGRHVPGYAAPAIAGL